MNIDPREKLLEGSKILDPMLEKHGFHFGVTTTGKGSGGNFATGVYVSGERRLELHYRYGLGIVRYHIGELELDHLQYMKLLGVYMDCRFASTQLDGGLDGFERLRDDLELYCGDFLYGDGRQFCSLARAN
jgi:hypothetical protein